MCPTIKKHGPDSCTVIEYVNQMRYSSYLPFNRWNK